MIPVPPMHSRSSVSFKTGMKMFNTQRTAVTLGRNSNCRIKLLCVTNDEKVKPSNQNIFDGRLLSDHIDGHPSDIRRKPNGTPQYVMSFEPHLTCGTQTSVHCRAVVSFRQNFNLTSLLTFMNLNDSMTDWYIAHLG
jgi:hypothetical protein